MGGTSTSASTASVATGSMELMAEPAGSEASSELLRARGRCCAGGCHFAHQHASATHAQLHAAGAAGQPGGARHALSTRPTCRRSAWQAQGAGSSSQGRPPYARHSTKGEPARWLRRTMPTRTSR